MLKWLSTLILSLMLLAPSYAGMAPMFMWSSGGFALTNWTSLNLGGGGNVSGLNIPPTGVRFARGDVFPDWIFGTDNTWHNLSTVGSMPGANFLFYPPNTTQNQGFQGILGMMEIAGCPASSSCAYKYQGGYIYYSDNISTSSPNSITWCNTGGFTQTGDTSNNVNSGNPHDPGQLIAIDPNNPAHVIVGTPSSGLFESFNANAIWSGGCNGSNATWTAISTSLIPLSNNNFPAYVIAFDPTSGTTTCHTGSGTCTSVAYIFTNGTTAGVYKTSNAGTSWALAGIGGPTVVSHMKVSSATAGAGHVWAADGSNLWLLIGSTWTEPVTSGGIVDVCIDPNNGNHVTGLNGGVVAFTNGASASPTYTFYAAVQGLSGDANWISWAGVGIEPGALECDPLNSGTLIAAMGQGVWTAQFPTTGSTITWEPLSSGIQGSVTWSLANTAAGQIAVGSQDISGCSFNIATASVPKNTCFPTAQFPVNNGLSFGTGLSRVPGTSTTFAEIGADGGAGIDWTGYSTDGFNTTYTPLNLWTATVASSASNITNNGSGGVRVTVPSTSLLHTWAAGDAITRNSIMCVLSPMPATIAQGFNGVCDEITVVDSTHFDMPNSGFNSNLQTTGYNLIFYVPGQATDINFGQTTIVNVVNDSGLVQVEAPLLQIGAGQQFCISGVTMSTTTVVNGCWVAQTGGYGQSPSLRGSAWQSGDIYVTGGVITENTNAGGNIAASTTSNIAMVGSNNTFPLCTANGGQTWTAMRVTGDAGTLGVTTVGTTNAGSTSVTLSGSASLASYQTAAVVLTSGRLLNITGSTASGTTLTLPFAVPPGDSIPASSQILTNSGYSTAYYNNNHFLDRDWVTPNTFYAVNTNAGLIKWTNCGTPAIIAAESAGTGWLAGIQNFRVKAVPGQAGHLFITAGPQGGNAFHPNNTSLYRVCNALTGSATVQRVPGFYEVEAIGFGAPAPGKSYATIYVVGWYNSADNPAIALRGIWESTDDPNNGATGSCNVASNTWTNIGTSSQNAAGGSPGGWMDYGVADIEGDQFVHGPVYLVGQFASFYGVFNFLLKRDIDPASNDNTPVGLNRVA